MVAEPARAAGPASSAPLLALDDVTVEFAGRRRLGRPPPAPVRAVDRVSLRVDRGEILGLVGESGCGKSTLGRVIAGIIEPTAGRVAIDGRDIASYRGAERRTLRRMLQMVFQNPYGALDPRMRVDAIVREPLDANGIGSPGERRERVAKALGLVGLGAQHAMALPGKLSGGQQQRVGIARALVTSPALLVCDEVTSALDVSIKMQISELLLALHRELDLVYVFISHDLGVVRRLATRIAVMYLGQIVELADTASFYAGPAHPYARALLTAVPIPDPAAERGRARLLITGEVPSPSNPPSGCRFRTRCPFAQQRCTDEPPQLRQIAGARTVACHFPLIGADSG